MRVADLSDLELAGLMMMLLVAQAPAQLFCLGAVFYGALTNVQYSIGVWHVVDSVWDLPQVSYENPLGNFASVADVDAFTPPVCTCPAVDAPVCGRDGRTYGNDCQAYCVGWVEIAHPGACTGD